MNFNKIFRVVVALLMVFCLVINISPVRAHAAGLGVTVAVAGLSVVACIIIGLGVMPGDSVLDFNNLVDDTLSHLSSIGYVDVDGMISLLKVVGASGSKLYVDENLINEVRQFIINTAVLTVKHTFLGSDVIASRHRLASSDEKNRMIEAQAYKYIVVIDSTSSYCGCCVLVSDVPFVVTFSDDNFYRYYTASDGNDFLFSSQGDPFYAIDKVSTVNDWSGPKSLFCDYVGSGVCTVESSLNLSFGHVNVTSSSITAGYTDWSSGSLTDDDENGESHNYWPVGVGDSYSSTVVQTQDEVWTGESTYEDTSTDSGTDVGGATSSISQSWLGSKLDSFILSISGFFSDIKSTVQAIPGAFSTWFQDVISSVQAIPGAFSTWFQDVISLLQSIPGTILSGIQAIFVPSADFVTAKVEALRARFDFINVFMDFIDGFKGELSGATPPVIYVHLENAEGSYNYGGTVKFLDMSWYSRYKSTGDAIISGFLWALFGWRMYLKLPGIINGVSGSVGAFNKFNRDGE